MLPGIAVFGTGSTIQCLVPVLKACDFKVEAIWGRTRTEADEAAKVLDIPFSTNKVDEALLCKNVELVVISCSPHLQSPIAVKALGIGKHVLCCPPAGLSQLQTYKMVTAACYYPSLMAIVGYGLRFLPALQKARQYIDEGSIGAVTVIEARVQCGSLLNEKYDWMCEEGMGGGVLNTYGGALIDLVTYLTHQKAEHVNGMLKTYVDRTAGIQGVRQITSDDFCSFQMELSNGVSVSISLNSHLPGTFVHEVLVCGTEGRLVVNGSTLQLFNNKSDRGEIITPEKREIISEPMLRLLLKNTDISAPFLEGLTQLVGVLRDACARTADRHAWLEEPVHRAATFEDALYVQTVIDAIRQSSRTHEWVKVKVMTEEPEPNPHLSSAVRRSTFSAY
ncbi:glucose-fructose oxidoreductase domain-containing protein 2 [Lingula anatina]|uniref:Glucose-fructose oxidoreductase domain-containing protein 2 n=1 Tax=Lingula anatina TaxID=7574 RepID=A0A1S3JNU9_LINAN|nr:glucose-fructose oxidoreductase domain-containing protein 2 [Lingula anatina]XP_013411816.1 glucose-fructose oxidoreductase domain-containing protein 2 [Lingula anatina]|eukprot:XP_013411815.1 glucose-fructose oxidoreductase domain-containing protein 2 [Lingula anatina]